VTTFALRQDITAKMMQMENKVLGKSLSIGEKKIGCLEDKTNQFYLKL